MRQQNYHEINPVENQLWRDSSYLHPHDGVYPLVAEFIAVVVKIKTLRELVVIAITIVE